MKIKFLFILTSILFITTIKAQKTYVPDNNFEQKLIDLGFDNVLDDSVLTININSIQSIDLNFSNIVDLTGIQGFTSLEYLNCEGNLISSIDLSNNNNLTYLNLSKTYIDTLDLTNNTHLEDLVFDNGNQFTSLDVSNCLVLESIHCTYNNLNSIDVSNLPSLRFLYCQDGYISNINVSNCPILSAINCSGNSLNSIDLSDNVNLSHFDGNRNNFESLDFSNNTFLRSVRVDFNQLLYLDLSSCTNEFRRLSVRHNPLERLNLANGLNHKLWEVNATSNPNLYCIQVDDSVVSTTNWMGLNPDFQFDSQVSFGLNCNYAINIPEEELNILQAYPNPMTNVLNVKLKDNATYRIYSIIGKVLLQSGNLQEGINTINLSDLNQGVYSMRVWNTEGLTYNETIIKL